MMHRQQNTFSKENETGFGAKSHNLGKCLIKHVNKDQSRSSILKGNKWKLHYMIIETIIT